MNGYDVTVCGSILLIIWSIILIVLSFFIMGLAYLISDRVWWTITGKNILALKSLVSVVADLCNLVYDHTGMRRDKVRKELEKIVKFRPGLIEDHDIQDIMKALKAISFDKGSDD